MQTLNFIETSNYNLNCYKMSTNNKIKSLENIITPSKIDFIFDFDIKE